MGSRADMVGTNLGLYRRPAKARWYASLTGLTAAETAAFALTRDAWEGREILDIGVGGGRTCEFLASGAARYVGLDYSPAMVAAARARHPTLDIRLADARDLSAFADASFDFAFFADNGLDAVDDAGRADILREVRRVLRPGGLFLFNSHNLDCARNGHYLCEMLSVTISRSPVATLRSLARIPIRIGNYLRSAGGGERTGRYAILHDPGNDFASPHYYAGAAEVRRQIEAAGLHLVNILGEDGREVDQVPERASATLYYLARAPATHGEP